MIEILAIKIALAGVVFFAVLNLAGFHTWVERKQSALIQDRIGANRASIFGFRALGLFHGIADPIKMLTKEDIVPTGADKTLHTLAPFFSVFFALVTFAAIPFGDQLVLGDRVIDLQVASINAALLYVFAMLSLGVYGVILAGFASRNNYAIMGGLRATAQMISYEIALGISIVGVIMVYGTMDLAELVRAQGYMIGGLDPDVGNRHPAYRFHNLFDRSPRRDQENPLRPAGSRVGDHRVLRRVQRHEVRDVLPHRFPRDHLGGVPRDDPLLRRVAGALPSAGRLPLPLGRESSWSPTGFTRSSEWRASRPRS